MMRARPAVFADPPVLCGHRGSGRGEGENTLASFRAAVAAGLPWVEVDGRLSGDGELVAHHDPLLPDGREIAALPAAATGLLRVADLLDALPPQVGVDIDLKTSLADAVRPPGATTAAAVAALADRERARRALLVTSFDPAALLAVRRAAPAVPTGLLTWVGFPLREAVPAAAQLGVDVVGVHVGGLLDERWLRDGVAVAHRAGLQVLAWCPGPRDADALAAAGADCLVVDDALSSFRSPTRRTRG